MMLHHKADEELMLEYQQGDDHAFEELYRRYSGRVYGYLKTRLKDASMVDDVFQSIFMKLHRSRSRYDAAFPFLPWLFTVSQSVMLDAIRKKERRREDVNPVAIERAVAQESCPTQAGVAVAQLPGLLSLPEGQRNALEMRYGCDLSFDEIARALETSPSNARQLVSRAVRRLRGGR